MLLSRESLRFWAGVDAETLSACPPHIQEFFKRFVEPELEEYRRWHLR